MKSILLATVVAAIVVQGAAPPPSMFGIYAANRAAGQPNYITEDFLLLSYSLILEDGIAEMEEKTAAPEFRDIVSRLGKALPKQPYFQVLGALLGGAAPTDPKAIQELELVRAANGIAPSPLFGQRIDYSQCKPRGKYTRNETLSRYFQAMRYAGLILFPVKESQATAVTAETADALTAQALEIARALQADSELEQTYSRFQGRMTWLFGPAEDLTLEDLREAEGQAAPRTVLLKLARERGHQPVILGGAIDTSKLETGVTAADALTGWRLFPSRYTPDSAALQLLVYDRVTEFQGKGSPFTAGLVQGKIVKAFPRAAELMALLGSKMAERQIAPDTKYTGYAAAQQAARERLTSGTGLAALHMQMIEQWLQGTGNPERRLNTALAFFTLHRHQNVLYAKQSYTAGVKSLPPMTERGRASIEAAPELYLLLRRVTARAAGELNYTPLVRYGALLDTAIDIALDAKAGRVLSAAQSAYLNGLDLDIAALASHADTPMVADIHTDPNTQQVVEEGIGFPRVVKQNGAVGALFTHREFKQPMDRRLTDEEWTAMLLRESEPAGGTSATEKPQGDPAK